MTMTIDMNALARSGAQARLAELATEIASLNAAFPGLGDASAPPKSEKPKRRRKMSAATKAKIKAAWANRRSVKAAQPAEEPAAKAATEAPAKKRTISAEGKARIAAAQKKRWAAVRKAKKR